MNREILFRGKISLGLWVYGCYVELFEEGGYIIDNKSVEVRKFAEVAPETVGQYTGLCDKNGVKIFEGDIIKYCPVYDDEKETGYIKWSKNRATYIVEVTDGAVDDFWEHTAKKCEVIGNIHDNPGLLEGEENESK